MRRLNASPRRRPARRWPRLTLRYGLPLLAVVGLGVAGGWWWASGGAERTWRQGVQALVAGTARLGWALGEVYVTGRVNTPREAVLAALDAELGDPLVAIDPHAVAARLAALGWVREARVERRFPATLLIHIEERVPLARWQHQGRIAVIDRSGAVIAGAAPAAFPGLPLLVGPDAPAAARELLAVLASEPALERRVVAAVRVGGRRWNVRFDSGVIAKLPEQNPAEAWQRLASHQRTYGVLERPGGYVDLRFRDRIITERAGGRSGEET